MRWLRDVKRLLPVMIALAALAGVNALILGKTQLCILRALTGLPCPGCGLVHSGFFLFTGDFQQSFFWHPLLLPLLFTLILAVLPDGCWSFADKFKRQTWWFVLLLIALIVVFIYRVIVYYPQQMGPMYYDTANYLQLIHDLIKNLLQ